MLSASCVFGHIDSNATRRGRTQPWHLTMLRLAIIAQSSSAHPDEKMVNVDRELTCGTNEAYTVPLNNQ